MGIFDKLGDIASKAARPARNVAIGYLTEKVNNTRLADEQNAEFIELATDQYFNVDKPQFLKEEKTRSNNINLIATRLSPIYSNYADYNNITLSDVSTRNFLDQIKNLSNEDKYKLESTIAERKLERSQTFDEKNKFIKDKFKNMTGGPGSTNMVDLFFPDEGKDVAETGIKQTEIETPTIAEPMQSVMQIEGTGSGTYDVTNNRHAVLQSQFDTDFRRFFVNDINQPTISFAKGAAQYDLVNELLKGYDESVKQGFKKGKYEYARLNYIDQELKREGITGYNTGFDTAVEATTSSIPEGSGEAGAVPGDGKKFDTETFGQRKEDAPKINLASQRQMLEPTAEQKVDNPASIINEARESISSIMEYDDVKADIVLQRAGLNQFMTSTLDEKKQALIAFTRKMAKDEIKNIGLNPENFEL
tara:strand:+ start:17 stop:1273 length:1257 start_codon:yes stop_codon:yes gene_type:complete